MNQLNNLILLGKSAFAIPIILDILAPFIFDNAVSHGRVSGIDPKYRHHLRPLIEKTGLPVLKFS